MLTAVYVAIGFLGILIANAAILAAATFWKRRIPLPWRLRGLRFTLWSALPIFILSLCMVVLAIHQGLINHPSRAFSLAFWPVSSGTIALLAWLSLRRLAKSDPPPRIRTSPSRPRVTDKPPSSGSAHPPS